ncbi:SWI/SNF-related matrix-associated actin-dependent regulator of chromatin subfamily A-like protein 1 isoform X2 [Ipomoea triloba]|uniref:SWI/SNF-related matrix-associated actin-dependent regulator of chromatin subfamily A-like protein 1 isoform X2 n=1 Tax=Ipomoea triloba TaxID=35885 RepID=UPI00125E083B|nr:SWI/SNF-related matrix-associated actin-dependent regulator of chromatin subfamily A-like protein 1 isoform X2 [Ipomoea triloba]
MELDDWEPSAEELDSLERDAMRQIAERNSSSYAATTSVQHTPASPHRPERSSASVKNAQSPPRRILPSFGANKATENLPRQQQQQQQQKRSVKLFLHASGDIAAKFVYDQLLIDALRKVPKASWNAKERLWMFPLSSLSSAEKILNGISCSNVENLDPLVQRAIVAANEVCDIQDLYESIPDSIKTKLMPFQRDGVRFALQHGARVLLADEMGLGKTIQAIAVSSCVRESWPVLVLTPSSLRLHWASMIQQWLDISPSDILVVLSQLSGSNRAGFKIVPSNAKRSIQLDGIFNIISYDTVPKLQDTLMASEFKVVIADESHFLKNAQAKRTNASLPILQKAKYAILLSGTPALSRPIELFKQLEALYPDVYKNVHEYGNRYCKGGIFGVYQGASNHEELHNLMKATVMIRRLKKDVLSELPVKRRQQVFLNLEEKEMKCINALFCELEIIKSKIKSSQSKDEAESLKLTMNNLINKVLFVVSVHYCGMISVQEKSNYKIYVASAKGKIPSVLDYLGTVIEADCKFLIFAHHAEMIDAIHQYLLKKKVGCIRIDGGTPAASRQALVTDFQEKASIKAAVLSIKAGGVGLTLTAASTVIFAELCWTPGDLIQAEDRAHRIGQVSSVNIYYLLANDTVDDIIWDVVKNKLENLGQMLDGQEKSLEVLEDNSSKSPMKQKTLDSFMKRCNTSSEHEPMPKYSRH